jgi:four helix bundle protein
MRFAPLVRRSALDSRLSTLGSGLWAFAERYLVCLTRVMSRDHRKRVVFQLADQLVTDVYKVSNAFPPSERFGLHTQLRRAAAVSAVCNIVEGCARRKTKEYLNFLNIASGSAAEAAYLSQLSVRLGFLAPIETNGIATSYGELVGKLNALINSLAGEP